MAATGGGGSGMAMAGQAQADSASACTAAATGHRPKAGPTAGKQHLKKTDRKKHRKVDRARQAWAHKYGVNRATMPNLAPVSQATARQQQAALTLLEDTERDTAKYANTTTAKAAGFDLQRAVAKRLNKTPQFAQALLRVDSGTSQPCHLPMVHVPNKANRHDGKVLDPNAPETLMYEYIGKGSWKLVGVMYTANESYPAAPPDPGGPITRWHYHPKSGGQQLMMHIFFGYGTDLAHAYEAEMTS